MENKKTTSAMTPVPWRANCWISWPTFTVNDLDKLAAPAPAVEGEPPEMTFAEAMALDPGEVEFKPPDCEWMPLDMAIGSFTVMTARKAQYRRKPAPVLSRVQEMVRAFMHSTARGRTASDDAAIVTDSEQAEFTASLEREFLGKGR